LRRSFVLLVALVLVWSAGTAATGQPHRHKPKPPHDACGVRPAKAGGGYWSCTFHDEFSGSTLDRHKWMPQTAFVTGTPAAHACYRPQNVNVAKGELNLVVRREPRRFTCINRSMGATTQYSAGSVMTYHLFSQQYGRFQARIKVSKTSAPGLQEDFWLWPDDRYQSADVWPAAGEIDVVELFSGRPDRAVPYLHYTANDNAGAKQGLNTSKNCVAMRGVWNTYTLVWTPTSLRIYVNGKRCLANTSGDKAFRKRYIIALTSALGAGPNQLTYQTLLPSVMNVDYVRVWK
jgi:beta-glucanase (GH16 family)